MSGRSVVSSAVAAFLLLFALIALPSCQHSRFQPDAAVADGGGADAGGAAAVGGDAAGSPDTAATPALADPVQPAGGAPAAGNPARPPDLGIPPHAAASGPAGAVDAWQQPGAVPIPRAETAPGPQADGAEAANRLAALAELGDLAGVRAALAAGASPDSRRADGIPALSLAARNGSFEVVEALLGARARPDAADPQGRTPLMEAARAGQTGIADMLLSRGADPRLSERTESLTALFYALLHAHDDTARELLARGADVNAGTRTGFTPLMVAVLRRDRVMAEALLARGADPRARKLDTGFTALMDAAANGDTVLVRALLARGADPEARNLRGETALMVAVRHGQLAAAQALERQLAGRVAPDTGTGG